MPILIKKELLNLADINEIPVTNDYYNYITERLIQKADDPKQTKTDKTPTFKPNEDLGEGIATKEELNYRTDLIGLLPTSYNALIDLAKDNTITTSQVKQETNSITNNKQIINNNLHDMFNPAVDKANTNLQNLKLDIKTITPPLSTLNSLQNQQQYNLQNISSTINDKITMGLQVCQVQNQSREKYDCPTEDDINSAYNQAQNRLDIMGWFGWSNAVSIGLYSVYSSAIFGGLIASNIVADWEDVGDEHECDDCFALAAGGPYSVLYFPLPPHLGCRCDQGEPYFGTPNESPV